MNKHKMAPKGARATYIGPPLEHMQDLMGQLSACLERHATVNSQARGEIKRLRDTNSEMLATLKHIAAIASDYAPKQPISGLDGQAILGHARAAIAKAEDQ